MTMSTAAAPLTAALYPRRGEGDFYWGWCSQGGGLSALPWANFLHPFRVLGMANGTKEHT